MNKTLLSIIILLSLGFSLNLVAEDADRGRLPDGRAYRVDQQGYQLVDYIAELELKVEELQTQLIAQANEKSYPSQTGSIEETDLITKETASYGEEVDNHALPFHCHS